MSFDKMAYEDFWKEDRFNVDVESNYPISPKLEKENKLKKKKKREKENIEHRIESKTDWWKFEEKIRSEIEENKNFTSFKKGVLDRYLNQAKLIKDSNKLSEIFLIRILRSNDFVVEDSIKALINVMKIRSKYGNIEIKEIDDVKEFLHKGVIYSPSSSRNIEGRRNLFIQLKAFNAKDGKEEFTKALLYILNDISDDLKSQKEGISVVIDLKDYNSQNVSLNYLKYINFLLLECTFIKVNEIYIANQPAIFFHSIEKALAPFKEKYIYLKKTPIVKYITAHNLPNYLGGTISMNLEIKFYISEKEEKMKTSNAILEKNGKAIGLFDLIKLPSKVIRNYVTTTNIKTNTRPSLHGNSKSEEDLKEKTPSLPGEKVKSLGEILQMEEVDKLLVYEPVLDSKELELNDSEEDEMKEEIALPEPILVSSSSEDLPILEDEDHSYESLGDLVSQFVQIVLGPSALETHKIDSFVFSDHFFSSFIEDKSFKKVDHYSFFDSIEKHSMNIDPTQSFFEVFVLSEKKYLNVLTSLRDNFLVPFRNYFTQISLKYKHKPSKKIFFLKNMESTIFSNLQEIIDFHSIFLQNVNSDNFYISLGVFSRNLEKYCIYCSNLRVALFSLQQYLHKKKFQRFLEKLEKNCPNDFVMSSLLFYPFLRLIFYSKFLNKVASFSSEEIKKENFLEARDAIVIILNLILNS
eukprot:TRINITY_DN1691_c0_g1_i1.p1 TRINITY_DN1691_c0_g1~~TRINITY_DN1691_c0_g1_i1.p1  ORF type:complete len:693 (-),score=208.96 TRINITY_DN1691_c0_g1_i1:77-2155(-)